MNAVILISGKIASGKTTFASALATQLGVAKSGFGDEVKARAEALGLPATREVWQELGAELVAKEPAPFCRAVLARGGYAPNQGLVVDGIRHAEIIDLLRTLIAPQPLLHVHVNSDEALRQSRADLRNRPGEIALTQADQHSTELQVAGKLPCIADIVVDGAAELSVMIKSAASEIQRRLGQP